MNLSALNAHEATIDIPRSSEFTAASQEVSDFVARLPLNAADNDRLIELLVSLVGVTERNAFAQGLVFAAMCADEPRYSVNS